MSETENLTSPEQTELKKHKKYTVLGQHLSGGPHGVGDPDDKTLRKVETDVLIREKMRLKSRTEKCADVVKEFVTCSNEAGLLLAFKCTAERDKLNECLKKWYENEEFKEECTQEYLRERSQFRRTGIPVKKWSRGKLASPQTESP